MVWASRVARGRGGTARRFAHAVTSLAALQLALGGLNVILLAPVWMQLVHLLVADLLWIAFVLLGASALGADSRETAVVRGHARPEGRAYVPTRPT